MSKYPEIESKMKKTAEVLRTQLASVRAGRANAAVLDQITVACPPPSSRSYPSQFPIRALL